MGFRPNYFICIAHLYLYYTLLVLHTYASYIRYWCIFFHYEIQYNLLVFLTWYHSHCSDFFFAVLFSLVLFQTHNCFRLYNCCCNHSPLNLWRVSVIVSCFGLVAAVIQSLETTAIPLPLWSLLRLCFCKYHQDRPPPIYPLVETWPSLELPRAVTRHQKILCKSSRVPRAIMLRHALSDFSTRLHAPGLHLLTSALGDVIIAMSSANVTRPHQLTSSTVDFDRGRFSRVDFFSVQVLLT